MVSAETQKIINAFNKKYGAGTIVIASDAAPVGPRFTTGSTSLDCALGGGWPSNQWHELVGSESHGKTAVALKTIAANQRRDPEFATVWVAAESFSKQYAEMCGVDLSRVILVETNIMEEAYTAAIDFAASRSVDCVVIDSLPMLVPMQEDEKDMDEYTVGRGALLTNKFFRKVGLATKRSLIEYERPFFGLVINQWRMKIGVMYGDPKTTPGGIGKDYAYFTRVEVKRDDWIEEGKGDNKKKVGQTIRARTIKNKSFPPNQVAYFDFYFDNGEHVKAGDFDFAKEMVALGVLDGIITRAGAWYTYGDIRTQGLDAMLEAVRSEPDVARALEAEVLSSVVDRIKGTK